MPKAYVRTAGVDPVDRNLRNGFCRPGEGGARFPAVLGSEAAGVVEAFGKIVIEVAG
ncbi:alcohol dehydrogenase catalytic domain-containing protein [Streptomyces hyaluromycini]|uniref:alcohol dehydrogenase catalytic domain-containing protein n=1 Tax=Streptomyces hyaluromycini TaxID=1377993 RepID=UPI003D9EF579